MKTEKYATLHSALENEARVMKGCWLAFAKANHHGLGAFALYEAAEREKMAMQVANHLLSHGVDVSLPALKAVQCDFPTPEEAIQAMKSSGARSVHAAEMLHESMISVGENPYFVEGMVKKMKWEEKEVEGVMDMLSEAKTPEDKIEMNSSLLKKYKGEH